MLRFIFMILFFAGLAYFRFFDKFSKNKGLTTSDFINQNVENIKEKAEILKAEEQANLKEEQAQKLRATM